MSKDGGQSSSFGGFQKGFLFSSKPSKTSKRNSSVAQTEDVNSKQSHAQSIQDEDVLCPKPCDSKSSSLEFPEVQEAMKASYPFLDTKSKSGDTLTTLYCFCL